MRGLFLKRIVKEQGILGQLCTMCQHGINMKRTVKCQKCGGIFCPHLAKIKRQLIKKNKKKKQKKRVGHMVSYEEIENMEKDDRLNRNPWQAIENYISLSEEMKEVVDIMLNTPTEFLDLIRREKFQVGLSKYLKKYKGWTNKELNEFWKK